MNRHQLVRFFCASGSMGFTLAAAASPVCQGATILFPGDANGWHVSGAVSDVLVRHNTFDNDRARSGLALSFETRN